MQCLGQAVYILGGDSSHGDAAVARHEDGVLLRETVHLPQPNHSLSIVNQGEILGIKALQM